MKIELILNDAGNKQILSSTPALPSPRPPNEKNTHEVMRTVCSPSNFYDWKSFSKSTHTHTHAVFPSANDSFAQAEYVKW